jgi:hypothetical protein
MIPRAVDRHLAVVEERITEAEDDVHCNILTSANNPRWVDREGVDCGAAPTVIVGGR